MPRPRAFLIVPVLILAFVLFNLLSVVAARYTDLLWFRDVSSTSKVGYTGVFSSLLRTQILLFFLHGVVMALIVGANMWIAYRLRPPYRPNSLEQQNLDRYRLIVEPRIRPAMAVVLTLIALMAGTGGAGSWKTWLLWVNRQPFGVEDPQFHKDIGYYAFSYPFYRHVAGFLFGAFVFATIVSVATHYLFGGIRLQSPGERIVPAARAHLSVLLGVLAAFKALFYYLDRYGLVFSTRGSVTGASYTDVNARLPVLFVLVFAATLCAVLFIANIRSRGFLLPGVAVSLLALSSIVVGFLIPLLVQTVRVRPNELRYERKYIDLNIKATQKAYGIDAVKYEEFKAGSSAGIEELRTAGGTLEHVRLLDPNKLKATFEQLQEIRPYFGFPETLDIDRYIGPDDKLQDYVVAVREADLKGLPADRKGNWLNEHVLYTHGTGFVAVPTDAVAADGKPDFSVRDIPTAGFLKITEPRVYFGELSPDYSIVNSPDSAEVDGLSELTSGDGGYRYTGTAGVRLSGIRRLFYAMRFREPNLLISGAAGGKARVIYDRNPRHRVEQVAPFLKLDSDPYPAVVDGKILWILDGYTTSSGYPYAELTDLDALTEDATTDTRRVQQPAEKINYIRNSVKATVDAFDGSVKLYTWDEQDPVLKVWKKAFPGVVLPKDQMPAGVRAHLRYPEDLFKVQRGLLARYHVTDASTFFSRQQDWLVPNDAAGPRDGDDKLLNPVAQPPYYVMLEEPGSERRSFSLTTPFVFRENLAAFASVSSDQGDYGTIRVKTVPPSGSIPGPLQVANAFLADARFSRDQTQFSGGASEIIYGNLLTLPVGEQLVYVMPVYVKGKEASAYPTLQRVLVGYGNKVGYGETFEDALRDAVTQTTTGAPPTSAPTATAPPTATATGTATPSPTAAAPVPATLGAAVQEALNAEAAAQAALRASPPDFAAYDREQRRLRAALARIAELTQTTATPTTVPKPTLTP